MTGTLSVNAPLAIQHGEEFEITAAPDAVACIVIGDGGSLQVHNMSLSLNDGIGIVNESSDTAAVSLPWASLQANNCPTALAGDFNLDLDVYGDFRTNNCGTAHDEGTLNIESSYRCSMFFNGSTGNGLTANNIVLGEECSITARGCGGNGVVAETIQMLKFSNITVENNGKQAVSTFALRRSTNETGYGMLVTDSLDMDGARIEAKNNKLSGLVVKDLDADEESSLTVTENGASNEAPAAVYITGTAVIKEGAKVEISNNPKGGVGVAPSAKLTMSTANIQHNGGNDIVNEGTVEIPKELKNKVSIKNTGTVTVTGKDTGEESANFLMLFFMRIGFADITVLDEAGQPAAGSAYDLYSERGRKLRTYTVDDNGVLSTRSLVRGTYYLVPADAAFDADSAYSFKIGGFGKRDTFEMTLAASEEN